MTIVVALALVVAALVAYIVVVWSRCAPGVAKMDGQCIGITDGTGSAPLGESTAVPLRVIGDENSRLDAEHPHDPTVTVAYVIPVPRPGRDAELAMSLAHDLMGAAVAQRQANRTTTIDGNRPYIRLVVANIGDSSAQWNEPVSKLIDMVHDDSDPRRVTAVAVSGWSLEPIGEAIDALVAADVPVITGRLTADQLTSKPVTPDIPMVRVAPSNSSQARAAAAYLRPTTKRALIVQDVNPEDYYAKNLGDQFKVAYPDAGHTVLDPPEVYDAKWPDVPKAMSGILQNICLRKPDVVFFTGRPEHLEAFVSQLPYRPCPGQPIRIMTGSAANTFATALAGNPRELGAGMRTNATVAFTALAHPDAWKQPSPVFKPEWHSYLDKPCNGICFQSLFRGETLDDGAVIIGYDVIGVAVHAIRSSGEVSPGAVAEEFKQMHGVRAFPGASGVFSFSPVGEPINKPTPILGVQPDGSIRFEQVSYPNTTPCIPDSTYCLPGS